MTARNWDNFLKRLPHNYTATAPCTSTTATAHSPPTSCCNTAQPTSLLANPSHHTQQPNQHRPNSLHHKRQRTDPTFPRYTAPFPITLPTTVKAAVFTEDGRPLAATRSRTFDHNTLLSVDTQELRNCSDKGPLGLRLPCYQTCPTPTPPCTTSTYSTPAGSSPKYASTTYKPSTSTPHA